MQLIRLDLEFHPGNEYAAYKIKNTGVLSYWLPIYGP